MKSIRQLADRIDNRVIHPGSGHFLQGCSNAGPSTGRSQSASPGRSTTTSVEKRIDTVAA
jgi:hypothetical protein